MIPRYVGTVGMLGAAALLILTVGGCPDLQGLFCPDCPEPNCPEPNCPDCPEPNCPDCNAPEPNAPQKALHERIFTEILGDPEYKGTRSCLNCRAKHSMRLCSPLN